MTEKSSKRKITVKVARSNPTPGPDPRYDSYQVEIDPGTSVTDLLKLINKEHGGGLAYRVACRQGVCGTCTMKVNGRPGLGCCIEASDDMLLEPAFPWNVVKDLVSESGKRPASE